MTNAELGRIIKEARIARKMTQSEVVGDFITRNMLSQIENGNAAPSMRTLQYLMDVLDIHINIEEISEYSSDSDTCITKPAVAESAGIFLSKEDNSSASGSSALISRLMQYKQFFAEGRYDTICRDIDNIPTDGDNIFHDEYCAIGARSCYEYARQLADCGNACDAVAYADKAAEYARQGIYSNNDILAKSILLSHEQALHLS